MKNNNSSNIRWFHCLDFIRQIPAPSLLILLAMILSFVTDALSQKYDRYDNYDFSNGMSSNFVDCIFEDSRGFLWIGTWDGLNRYDGYDFVQYKSDYTDSTNSLAGNLIFNITEDRDSNLWICTNNGLCRYDYDFNNFEIIQSFYGFSVKCLVQAEDGYLWISTIRGLYKYNYKQNEILERYYEYGDSKALISNDLSDLIIDSHQNLWIATMNNGLIYFNTETNQQINYLDKPGKMSLQSNKIRTLVFDTESRLWLGSFDNGIIILDTVLKTAEYKRHEKNNANSIGSNGVSRLMCDSQGTIWVCCQNGYLNRYNERTGGFTRFQYNTYSSTSLKTKSISCIYEDRTGNYWIGTHGNGISRLNRFQKQFKVYTVMPNLPNSLPDNKISSFTEMEDGNLAIGTDGGGFCIFDRRDETFETYNTSQGLMSDAVTDVTRGNSNQLWISTWNGGIALFDYKTKKIKSYTHDTKDQNSLVFNNIKNIMISNDTLWIATHGDGIALFDQKQNKFISHLNQKQVPFDLKTPMWANSILKDGKNRYWIATAYLLYCYDGKQLKTYAMDVDDSSSISGNQIACVYEDSQHTIWVITDNGIDRYVDKTDSFEKNSVSKHLPKNAKAIIEDNNHRLWISNGTELVRFDPETQTLKRYTANDGLPENDYLQRSAYKLKDGSLLFGGTDGFVMFHPDSLMPNTHRPTVELINLFVYYQLQIPSTDSKSLKKALLNTDTLMLDYSKEVVSLDFAGIELSNPRSQTYKYQIQGLNPKWIDLGEVRKITLPTLSPGNYTLNILSLTSEGLQSDNKQLVIVVMPAWWQTWWFRLLLAMIFSGLIVALFQYRMQQVKRHNRQLEQTVAERTSELVVANGELKELNNTKNKLFSIIAHDLKNPINVLTGFSSLLINNFSTTSDEKKLKFLGLISESSKNIFHQLEQLLNWAMVQSNSLHHHPHDTDIKTVINEVTSLLATMAANKEISIRTSAELTKMAYVDTEMISTVIRNLTSNALKFTPKGGTVTIDARVIDGMIEINIADSGIGMTDEQCAKLFSSNENQSTYGTNNEKGTGLGLVICKEFIEKNGGSISVKSQLGKGSCFTCLIPAGCECTVPPIEKELHASPEPSAATETETETDIETITETEIDSPTEATEKPVLLVVEDSANIARYIEESLQAYYEIVLAPDGRIGLEKCRELLPDLIISDVSMPEMDGEQMCVAIKSDPLTNHIPLILLTARNLPEQQLDGLKKGADDYIFKPFDIAVLHEKIKSILRNRELFRDHIRRQMICQPHEQIPASQDDKFLDAVVQLIEANLAEPHLTVEFLAKEMGLSRSQLFRKFKAVVGLAPVEFIRNLKLRRAAQMLKTGNWRVSDVAYSVGFADPQYFSNCFQKEYGVLPSQYAKNQ